MKRKKVPGEVYCCRCDVTCPLSGISDEPLLVVRWKRPIRVRQTAYDGDSDRGMQGTGNRRNQMCPLYFGDHRCCLFCLRKCCLMRSDAQRTIGVELAHGFVHVVREGCFFASREDFETLSHRENGGKQVQSGLGTTRQRRLTSVSSVARVSNSKSRQTAPHFRDRSLSAALSFRETRLPIEFSV